MTDLPAIVAILAEDRIGNSRENSGAEWFAKYSTAFDKIDCNKDQVILVAADENDEVTGTMQLTFIQYLTFIGGLRAQAEAVFVRSDKRGQGIGTQLMNEAVRIAKDRGAHMLQLTTDKRRSEAVRFYEKLGFVASHEGMKMHFK